MSTPPQQSTPAVWPENLVELKKANAELNLREMRAGAIALASMPRYVMIELTQGCNLRCPMCRSNAIGYRDREMSRETLRSVAETLFPAAETVDIRGWGESLLLPDIQDIIDLVADYRARCRVVTNLSFTRPTVLDRLADIRAMVDVSLDAPSQEVLARARTGVRFDLVDANLRCLTGRLLEHSGNTDGVRIVATVQRCTVASLSDLVEYAADANVAEVTLNEVTLAPGDPKALDGMDDEVDAAVEQAAERAAKLGVRLCAGTRFGTRVGLKKEMPFCLHPWSYVTVGYDGSIGFCDHLIGPMMQFYCMGDVGLSGFREIWNGEAWRALRQWHAGGHRDEPDAYRACSQCYRHRNVDFEDLFEPKLQRYRLDLEPVGERR